MKRLRPFPLLCTLVLAVPTATSAQVVPADDVEELVMVTGAGHVLQMTSQCTSMFLRMNPIPTGQFDVEVSQMSEGQATVTLRADAPFDWGTSEIEVILYEEEGYASLECSGSVPLAEGAGDLIWNALHRHTRGIGALMWGADVGEAPAVLSTNTCLEDFPTAFAVIQWQVRLSRPDDQPDTINFFVYGDQGAWGEGCLELE